MIGVLAVIAILAALLIPKVFNAINDARINSAVVSADTVKTAVIDQYSKNGRFDATNQVAIPNFAAPWYGYDTNVLMVQQLLDKPFITKAGTNSVIQVRACVAAGTAVDGVNAAYALDGNGGLSAGLNTASGQYVVEAVISGVSESDAQAISQRIDGASMSTAGFNPGTADFSGRVKYGTPAGGAGGATTVLIYLAHR
ncbi:MAG: hypothetical protein C5B50_02545 [Verrucomicrobia bacterium]|nr:MAG: hypothetical protein C5B50_02545 [Verrucomicrobiota bacterium]